jgi:hypothetical protein
MLWRTLKVKALLWPLICRSTCAQPAIVVVGTTDEGAALTSVRLVGVGSATHVVADTTVEGADLASVRLVCVGSSSSHCSAWHER